MSLGRPVIRAMVHCMYGLGKEGREKLGNRVFEEGGTTLKKCNGDLQFIEKNKKKGFIVIG